MGVYDMAGSVSEWMNEWWLEDRKHRWFNGGSWANGPEEMFKVRGGNGAPATYTIDTVGFRLVLRMDGGRSLDSSPPPP